jgi:hypothetical protein
MRMLDAPATVKTPLRRRVTPPTLMTTSVLFPMS